MKEAEQTQHKMRLDVLDGFRLFWGFILGVVSLSFVSGFVSLVFYAILFIVGKVGLK